MGVAGGHMQPVRTPLGIVDGPVALAWCTAVELTGSFLKKINENKRNHASNENVQ
jgi:hypothetical protein